MSKIIHLLTGSQFIERIKNNYDAAFPQQNTYIILNSNPDLLAGKDEIRITEENSAYAIIRKLSESSEDIVILHALCPWKVDLGLSLLPHVKVIPCLWGVEVMMVLPMGLRDIHEEQTYRYIMRHKSFLKKQKAYLWNEIPFIVKSSLFGQARKTLKLLKSVPYFSGVLDVECELVIKHNRLKASFIRLPVGNLEYSLPDTGKSETVVHDKVLLGHANTVLANHVDTLDYIKDQLAADQQVILPLSYGSAGEEYKKFVYQSSVEILGDRCVPLMDLMPIHEYFEFVGRSFAYLAPQKIQAGLGNIYTLLHQGVNVYLPEINPIYKSLLDKGVVIGSLDKLKSKRAGVKPLCEEDADNNKKIIQDYSSRKSVIEAIRKSIELVRAS